MNINVKWMNSLKDEGIMNWLNDIMSDWRIAQCWKFKWKSTHCTELRFLFYPVIPVHAQSTQQTSRNFLWPSFLDEIIRSVSVLVLLALGQTSNSVSGDPEHRNSTCMSLGMCYLSSRIVQEVEWYQLDGWDWTAEHHCVGAPQRKIWQCLCNCMSRRGRLGFGVCWG